MEFIEWGCQNEIVCPSCGSVPRPFMYRLGVCIGVYCTRCDESYCREHLSVLADDCGVRLDEHFREASQECEAASLPVLWRDGDSIHDYWRRYLAYRDGQDEPSTDVWTASTRYESVERSHTEALHMLRLLAL